MSPSDFAKLAGLVLFAMAVFAAGFLLGMAREQEVWQRAAVANHAAAWEHNKYTGEWIFYWTPAPITEEAKRH